MTAPERIWTASTNGKCHVGFDTPSLNYVNEYVRADLSTYAAGYEAALRARIKPLVWEDADEGMCTKWRAPALLGNYELVELDKGGGLSVNFSWGRPLSFWFIQGEPNEYGPTGPKQFPTLEAAKAAAQSDYEARIISALAPDPDRLPALTAAAYEDAATITSRHKRYWEDAAADIRARIPADALAARSRIEAQAEARGMRKAAGHLRDQGYGKAVREILALADATEAAAKGGV